jgi:hypothetical protein
MDHRAVLTNSATRAVNTPNQHALQPPEFQERQVRYCCAMGCPRLGTTNHVLALMPER